MVTIVKCSCGECDRYGLSEGTFYMGSGWSKERAQEYADAINYYDEVIAQRNKTEKPVDK